MSFTAWPGSCRVTATTSLRATWWRHPAAAICRHGSAVIDAGAALRAAVDCLHRGLAEAAGDQAAAPPGQAGHPAAAASALTAGRDLLHTHRVTDPAGLMHDRSEWAPVVTSLAVLRALADQIGCWSQQIAPVTALLAGSATGHGAPAGPGQAVWVTARWEFTAASQWLQARWRCRAPGT